MIDAAYSTKRAAPASARRPMRAGAAVLAAAAILAATAAVAHHGWSWAEGEPTTLEGTIRTIEFAPPHPTLDVETAADGLWHIELGNPRQTERSGFVEGEAAVGDPIVVLGNRSMEPDAKVMKAVRITVGDRSYDIYPSRIPQ